MVSKFLILILFLGVSLSLLSCSSAPKEGDQAVADALPSEPAAQDPEDDPDFSEVAKSAATDNSAKGRVVLNKYLDIPKNLGLEKFDTLNKSLSDVFIIFKRIEGGGRTPVIHLFDLNRDGKIDLAKHFEEGKIVRVEADLDNDGLVDVTSYYDPKTGELQRKLMSDSGTNIWKYYFKNELRKKELDRNSDGKPDIWVYYRNGRVVTTEVDKDFKGTIVRINGPLRASLDK